MSCPKINKRSSHMTETAQFHPTVGGPCPSSPPLNSRSAHNPFGNTAGGQCPSSPPLNSRSAHNPFGNTGAGFGNMNQQNVNVNFGGKTYPVNVPKNCGSDTLFAECRKQLPRGLNKETFQLFNADSRQTISSGMTDFPSLSPGSNLHVTMTTPGG